MGPSISAFVPIEKLLFYELVSLYARPFQTFCGTISVACNRDSGNSFHFVTKGSHMFLKVKGKQVKDTVISF